MDLRKCRRCGYRGPLSSFQAEGEEKRYDLCKDCWVTVRKEKFDTIEISVDGTNLDYISIELSRADFDRVLDNLQTVMGLGDGVIAAIRARGILPFMERTRETQLVYKR